MKGPLSKSDVWMVKSWMQSHAMLAVHDLWYINSVLSITFSTELWLPTSWCLYKADWKSYTFVEGTMSKFGDLKGQTRLSNKDVQPVHQLTPSCVVLTFQLILFSSFPTLYSINRELPPLFQMSKFFQRIPYSWINIILPYFLLKF